MAVRIERRVGDDPELLRAPAARQRSVLEAVVTEVLHAADPHAHGDIRHDPPGQDGDVDPARSLGRDPCERAQAALRDRLDDRHRRVAGTDRKRPVEVGDDQDGPGGSEGDRRFRDVGRGRDHGGPPAAVTA